MDKLLLMSILIVTFALPMRASRDPSPVRGLRRTVVGMTIFVALYILGVVYVYPHL